MKYLFEKVSFDVILITHYYAISRIPEFPNV